MCCNTCHCSSIRFVISVQWYILFLRILYYSMSACVCVYLGDLVASSYTFYLFCAIGVLFIERRILTVVLPKRRDYVTWFYVFWKEGKGNLLFVFFLHFWIFFNCTGNFRYLLSFDTKRKYWRLFLYDIFLNINYVYK